MRFAAKGACSRARALLLSVLLAMAATTSTTEAAGCNNIAIKASSHPRKVRVGGTVRLSIKLKNLASSPVVGQFQVVLPPGATLFKSASASPMKVSGYNKAVAAEYVADTTMNSARIVWPEVPIAAGKTRRLTAKVLVGKCETMPETLYFQAFAAQLAASEAAECQLDAPVQALAVRNQAKWYARAHRKNTTADDLCPVAYQLTAVGSKCAGTPTATLNTNPSIDSCYTFW